MTLRPSGLRADYRGQTYDVLSSSDTSVNLATSGPTLPDEIGRGETRGRSWAKVPNAALDRLTKVRVVASWRGEEVEVTGVGEGRVTFSFLGSEGFARANGLAGSGFEGWGGNAYLDEVENVQEETTELPR